MTAEELWRKSGINDEYDAWAFGDDTDHLAELVNFGIKTATSSLKCLYELEGEPLPQPGEYSVILDSNEEAVCIIRTTKVYIVPFNKVSEEHARHEGEGDRTLAYWRRVHQAFFAEELKAVGKAFDDEIDIVCEEFKVVQSAAFQNSAKSRSGEGQRLSL